MDGRDPLLAYKLPGTQGCLPGFDVFSPRSRGVSYHSQDGQYGGCVPHKPSRRFMVAHPGQACAPYFPLFPRQVILFEGGSRSGNTEPCGRFSVETEAQAGGMDVEPSDGIPDLGSVLQSGGGPLCLSRVIPVPALVLPEFPDDSGHRCVRPSMAECQSVRVSANKADSGSTMQSEGERCPSPSHSPILALPDLVLGANSPLVSVSLEDSDQAGLTVPTSGQDLASSTRALEVVGMAHTGPRAVIDVLPVKVQETIASARAPVTRKPLESASERILTLKVALLLALTSLKRVGDLQAFSVSETCMDFAPGLVKVTLRPRPGYIPKVFDLRWSRFTLSILLPMLQVRMRDSTCSARSGH